MSVRYLDLADFLLIAEAALGVEVSVLQRLTALHLAESALAAPAAEFGGVEFYPEFITKVAVLCARLARNHPLPDGNKRVAYLCAVEFAERNGYEWELPPGDEQGGAQTVKVIESLASGEMTEEQLAAWVEDRLKRPE
jgi:death-on-curing protein